MGRFYVSDPKDPDAPVLLSEYHGIRPGDRVTATSITPAAGPLVVDEIYEFRDNGHGGWVTAILNDGQWETSADNLRRISPAPGDGEEGLTGA